MLLRQLILCAIVWSLSWPAAAQEIFSSPFRDANTYLQLRGEAPNASIRYRYEVVTAGPRPGTTEVTIDVASDWSLVASENSVVLRDFRLGRLFAIEGSTFTSYNLLGEVTFRVMEFQNRQYLARVLAATAPELATQDPCDIATELGVLLPGAASNSTFSEDGGVTVLRCNERVLGSFSPAPGDPPPAAFWPTLRVVAPLHPALFQRVRTTQLAPQLVEATFSLGGSVTASHEWRLMGVETTDRPYPLSTGMINATATPLDGASVIGVGQIAADAIAGTANGGAPTLQSWSAHLDSVARDEGRAAAAMLLTPTLNMFPELQLSCQQGDAHAACQLIGSLRDIAEANTVVKSLFELVLAEQRGDGVAALAAMERARGSELADHAVLGASYALAILKFDQQTMERARTEGLPTDPAPLTLAAIRAYPYNPAYWTDYGDQLGANYRWPEALLFYDVAYSLPTATSSNAVLRNKAETFARVRRDFPDFFLPIPD